VANHRPRFIPDYKSVESIRGNFEDLFSLINKLDIGNGKTRGNGGTGGSINIGPQTPSAVVIPNNPNLGYPKFYTRTLSAAQNAYVMLGSWDITTTGYVNKMACVNTGKSTDEAALYYHFCAQKDATGGNWYKTFSIKKQDTAGPEIGIEINVSATTAQIRIATYRAW